MKQQLQTSNCLAHRNMEKEGDHVVNDRKGCFPDKWKCASSHKQTTGTLCATALQCWGPSMTSQAMHPMTSKQSFETSETSRTNNNKREASSLSLSPSLFFSFLSLSFFSHFSINKMHRFAVLTTLTKACQIWHALVRVVSTCS